MINRQHKIHILVKGKLRFHDWGISIHANSPGLSGSLLDMEQISRSPVQVTRYLRLNCFGGRGRVGLQQEVCG